MKSNHSRVRAAVLAATLTAGVGGAIWMSGPASAQTDDTDIVDPDIVDTTVVENSDDATSVDDGSADTATDAAADGCDHSGSGRGRRDGSAPSGTADEPATDSSTAETPATTSSETETTTVDTGEL